MPKILHVLTGLGRGGIETWLVQVLQASESIRKNSAICLIQKGSMERAYLESVESLGVPVVRAPKSRNGLQFVANIRRAIREARPRVVHSQLNYLSGVATLAASLEAVPSRISHYHITYSIPGFAVARRAAFSAIASMENLCATEVLACSDLVLRSRLSIGIGRPKSAHVHYCGIDLEAVHSARCEPSLRERLGIDSSRLVVGHVGRFVEQKNHRHLLEIFREILKLEPSAVLLLVGDGPLRPRVEALVAAMQLGDSVRFLGLRADVVQLMRSCMDVFVLPSLFEGLPIVLLEAQATGLRCFFSDEISSETAVFPDLCTRLSLLDGPGKWAQQIVYSGQATNRTGPSRSAMLVGERFDIVASASALARYYDL